MPLFFAFFHLGSLLLLFPLEGSALQCQSVFSVYSAGMPNHSASRGLRPVGQLPLNLDLTRFPWQTAARSYIEMARHGELLQQTEPVLTARGLLVENGGLCGSTCLVNVLGAMTSIPGQSRSFRQIAPDLVAHTVSTYNQFTQSDGRYGVVVRDLAEAFQHLSGEFVAGTGFFDPFRRIDFSVQYLEAEIYPNRIHSALRGDTLAIATVRPVSRPESDPSPGHAITILQMDTGNRHLYVSDPNQPNTILRLPFEYTQGTEFVFRLPFTYGRDPVQIVQMTSFTRHWIEDR